MKVDKLGKVRRSWKRHFGGRRFSLTAYLVEPFKQIRFGLYVIGVCFLYLVLLLIAIYWAIKELYAQVMEWFKIAQEAQGDLLVNNVSTKVVIVIGIVLAAFVINMLVVVVRRTHRIYGPVISINRFLQALSEGKYSTRLRIREKDDLQGLVNKLNLLAVALHERHGKTNLEPPNSLLDEEDFDENIVSVEKPNDEIK